MKLIYFFTIVLAALSTILELYYAITREEKRERIISFSAFIFNLWIVYLLFSYFGLILGW